MNRCIVVIMTIMSLFAISCRGQVDNSPVARLDAGRYLGKWYEIARFDHSFERGIEYATAEYSMRDDGKIRVLNSGLKNGKYKESEGKAKFTDHEAILRVSFFGPFYSDYRVLMVTEDYQYALVGSGSEEYLWILSRTPEVPDGMREIILDEARMRGYDVDDLVWVKQAPNIM